GKLLVPTFDHVPTESLTSLERDSRFQFHLNFPYPPVPLPPWTSAALHREAGKCRLAVVESKRVLPGDVVETLKRWSSRCQDRTDKVLESGRTTTTAEARELRMCHVALEWQLLHAKKIAEWDQVVGVAEKRAVSEIEGWLCGGPGWGFVVLEKELMA
ncbi:hypothetical protein HDU93_002406, partial [Gonapodya sp. JEL0774]